LNETWRNIEENIRKALKGKSELVITFSGGKDSTALCFAIINSLKGEVFSGNIKILYSDTFVDPPPLRKTASRSMRLFSEIGSSVGLNIERKIIKPPLKHNFWVLLIGKGYAPPSYRFRWCTPRLKTRPIKSFLKSIQKEIGQFPVVFSGVRLDESPNRKRTLEKRLNKNNKWMSFDGLKDCRVFAPFAHLSTVGII